jgi:type II secretory pathway pseudopilin PulG
MIFWGSRKKAGFTLMELMVYIALLGGIVLIAGQAFSDSTKMRVRTQNMLQASEVAESVANLIKADVAQTGAKSSMEDEVSGLGAQYGNKFSGIDMDMYMNPGEGDSSSFTVINRNGFDSLTIRRLRFDDCGFFLAKEQIAWYVQNGTLRRKCKFLPNVIVHIPEGGGDPVVENVTLPVHGAQCKSTIPADDPCNDSTEVEIAEGVSTFNVIPGKPGVVGDNIQLFPESGVAEFRLVGRNDGNRKLLLVSNEKSEINKGGLTQTLSNFFQNYDKAPGERKFNELIVIRNETTTETSWQALCSKEGNHFTFEPGELYEISFEISSPSEDADKSKMFVPGEDHMAVGLRDKETGDLPKVNDVVQVRDFTFFPPMGLKGEGGGPGRSMRFSVAQKVENACLAFTFACYSPLVSQGKVSITNLRLTKVPSANYNFETYDFESHKQDKQNVKAFLLKLDIKRSGESGHVEVVIPAPSNGPHD